MKFLILVSVIGFSVIGVIGIQSVDATQCIPLSIRIEPLRGDYGEAKLLDREHNFEIGKDTIIIKREIVSLVDHIQTVNLGIISNDDGVTYSQTCSIPQNIFESFGNDGRHFEIISEQSIRLQPGEIVPIEMKLKPLKSGSYIIHIISHSSAFDKTHPVFPISGTYERVTITGNDIITMYDVMFIGLFSIVGVGIFVTVFLGLRKMVK